MRTILPLMMILAAAAAGCAPRDGEPAVKGGPGRIVGRVVEVPGDGPLEGVRVCLVYAGSESAAAVTDAGGSFSIARGPAGADPLAIRAEKDGYVRGYRALGGTSSSEGAGPGTGDRHVLRLLREEPRALIAGLKHPEVEVRCDAARALGRLPWREAVEALRQCLKDESGLVRFAAKEALGQIERPAP